MNVPLPQFHAPVRRYVLLFSTMLLVLVGCVGITQGQTEDSFGDGADPVKLFESGQNAHARGDLNRALQLYDEALKVRPEFPEAEFQRSTLFVTMERLTEAEAGFRRAIELKKDWSLPYSSLGALLIRLKRDSEAEASLRQALKLDTQNNLALRMLADIRLRAGFPKEALELATRATKASDAPPATWLLRALAERAAGDNISALASLDHLLEIEPLQLAALIERAELRLAAGDKERAIADLSTAEPLVKGDKSYASRIVAAYQQAGKADDALRIAKASGLVDATTSTGGGTKGVIGTPEEIASANSDDPEIAKPALEKLLQKNPNSAMLLSRLGDINRKLDPARSLDFYRRALEIEPNNVTYATGYSSALVQARRFPEAVAVLRRIISHSPDNYAAHANLATALYALKSFPEALTEYQWLLAARPDLTITHYFIATAHDNLGAYDAALASYELFLAKANQSTNELEIEKVKLRLPSLRRQIQLGQGVKKGDKKRKP
jgi:tetratricopeptide (TPR) repeat protein